MAPQKAEGQVECLKTAEGGGRGVQGDGHGKEAIERATGNYKEQQTKWKTGR